MPEPAPVQQVPAVLQGRYRLGEVLGRGGASIVLRAHDDLLGRDVAVKVFTARAADPQDLKAQEAEARMLGSLNHHALVTLLDAGIDLTDVHAPQVYLVLELLRDSDLRRRLAAGPLTALQVGYLGFDLAGALDYVHGHGIIHRDVKPANVLLVESGGGRPARAKLADFGIALLRGDGDLPGDQTTGTAAYLSPEQVEGDPLTPATDVYSLGLVLLEALTGRPAFPGTVLESALARLERDPEVPASIPPVLRALLQDMTARDTAARPSAAQAEGRFRDHIVSVLGGTTARTGGEAARLEVVRRYNLLDTPPDDAFDRITSLAARLFDVPIALVGIVDAERVWFKSRVGTPVQEVPRGGGSTTSGGLTDRTLVVPDLADDPRFATTPLAAAVQGVRFYAGAPLLTADGHNLGMLAVADRRPRAFSADEVAVLEDLAAMVLHELELRAAARRAVLERD